MSIIPTYHATDFQTESDIPVALVLITNSGIDIAYMQAKTVSDFDSYTKLQSEHFEKLDNFSEENLFEILEDFGWIPIHYER